jgi:Ni/Co efflux regulator RcnB
VRPPPRPPGNVRPPPRPGGPQFSWRGRNFNRFRGPAFIWPRGFSYRRWASGAFLPSIFWSPQFWFNDWGMLGIGAPPPGRRWVRYGPDLLLVNIHTRRIEDVIYDVFF